MFELLLTLFITFAFGLTLVHSSSYFYLTVSLAFTTPVSAAVVATVTSQPQPMSPLRNRPPILYTCPAPLTSTSGYNKRRCQKYSAPRLLLTVLTDFLTLSLCCSLRLSFHPHLDGSADVVQCPTRKESITQEPLNLSSREKPRSPLHKANGRIPGSVV